MGEISPPPQPVTGIAVGHGKGSEAVLAGYHIGPEWPSACGTRPVFMQDMVGIGGLPGGSGPHVARGSIRHSGMRRKAQTRNLEIPGSMLRIAPE